MSRAGLGVRAWLALVVACAAISAADGQGVVVAVVPFEAVFIDGAKIDAAQPAAKAMADLFQAQLSEVGHVTLVERERIDAVLAEQALSLSGLIDPATAARVGQLLKADIVVVGRVRPLEKDQRLASLRAVSVSDTRVLWSGEAQGNDAAVAGQAAGLSAEFGEALLRDRGPELAAGTTPLAAVKHHERAASLRALGAPEESATEELLALAQDPDLAAAELGFLTVLAEAGFERLAAVQAIAALAAHPEVPADAPLRALAKGLAMPTAARREEPPGSLETQSLLRFCELMARRVREAPAVRQSATRQDEVRAWILLGDAYVAEHRDRKARSAYQQAMTRLWTLRARDTATMMHANFTFPRICDTAATRAFELTATRRNDRRLGAQIDGPLLATLREALANKQRLPDDALPPLTVYHQVVPLADRVLLPHLGTEQGMDLLIRLDLRGLPDGAQVVDAMLFGVDSQPGQISPATTRWVGAEATVALARAGVAWPAQGPFGNEAVLGRTRFINEDHGPRGLRACVATSLRLGDQDRGIVVLNALSRRPAAMPEVRVEIDVVLPPGTPAAGLRPSLHTRVALGVHRLLTGDAAAARREFAAIETDRLLQPGDRNQSDLIRDLLALCGEAP